jgi:hypothetical protein
MHNYDEEEELAFSEKVLFTYIGTAGTTCLIIIALCIFKWWVS